MKKHCIKAITMVLSLIMCIGFTAPLCSATESESPDATAHSLVDTVKDKIRGSYTYRCDIETDEQLEALDVNRGFRIYALTEAMVSKSDSSLDYTDQDGLGIWWKYLLTPNGEYGPGIQITIIEEQSDGTYQLGEYGGKAKPFLDAFNEAKNEAKAIGMSLVENEVITEDFLTYFFKATDGKTDMIIPVSFWGENYTIHPAMTVRKLREHLLANIAENERLREENGGEIPLGASFRFDLLNDDAATTVSSEKADNYLWLYIAGCAVIIAAVLAAVLITRRKHVADKR